MAFIYFSGMVYVHLSQNQPKVLVNSFYTGGRGLSQDDSAHHALTGGITEWFGEDENDVFQIHQIKHLSDSFLQNSSRDLMPRCVEDVLVAHGDPTPN